MATKLGPKRPLPSVFFRDTMISPDVHHWGVCMEAARRPSLLAASIWAMMATVTVASSLHQRYCPILSMGSERRKSGAVGVATPVDQGAPALSTPQSRYRFTLPI